MKLSKGEVLFSWTEYFGQRDYTKDEILYLNCIYFGEECYGIKEASAHYYGVGPADLSEQQADSLVYTIKCPNLYNPNEI